jgi:hypothetical protein
MFGRVDYPRAIFVGYGRVDPPGVTPVTPNVQLHKKSDGALFAAGVGTSSIKRTAAAAWLDRDWSPIEPGTHSHLRAKDKQMTSRLSLSVPKLSWEAKLDSRTNRVNPFHGGPATGILRTAAAVIA